MSVTDPLIKRLKGYMKVLRADPKPVTDDHPTAQPFCETLELIFRKGLKQTNAVFGRNRKDYWSWVTLLGSGNVSDRVNPILSMVISEVKNNKKVHTNQGRGRLFLRLALQKKVLCVPIEHITRNHELLQMWYDPGISILGDEILYQILMSVLFEATEINFKLTLRNSSFLDETWILPVYKLYEFVPCQDIGVQVQYVDGRAIVTSVERGSVAEEDRKIGNGDVIDELLGESLHGVRKGKIRELLKQNQGFPVYIGIVKCLMKDDSIFKPIHELLRKAGKDFASLQQVLDDDAKREKLNRVPPHAQLPEDEYDELPVHSADDAANYSVEFLGNIVVGLDGGVHMIEGVIKDLVIDKGQLNGQPACIQLAETEVIVVDLKTKEELLRHSYTEIASCGRRIDFVKYFAYIAGETTCTLAKRFVAYVFKAKTDEESKTILCSVAQGFGRTHWFV